MNPKTQIMRKSAKIPYSAILRGNEIVNTSGYKFCKEIVTEVAETMLTDIIGHYADYQRQKLESAVMGLFDSGNSTMLTFEVLNSIDFLMTLVATSSYEDIEPSVSDADNYNRKELGRRVHIAPRSASKLWGKGLNKIKSATVLSKVAHKSVRKVKKQQTYLHIDFGVTKLNRANSMDQQLRVEKNNNILKSKLPKYMSRVT